MFHYYHTHKDFFISARERKRERGSVLCNFNVIQTAAASIGRANYGTDAKKGLSGPRREKPRSLTCTHPSLKWGPKLLTWTEKTNFLRQVFFLIRNYFCSVSAFKSNTTWRLHGFCHENQQRHLDLQMRTDNEIIFSLSP